MGLFYVPFLGRHFVWVKLNGETMSRLDRVMVSDGWWDSLGMASLACLWALDIDVSIITLWC